MKKEFIIVYNEKCRQCRPEVRLHILCSWSWSTLSTKASCVIISKKRVKSQFNDTLKRWSLIPFLTALQSVTGLCDSWLSHTRAETTVLSKATDYLVTNLRGERQRTARKKVSPQPGIEPQPPGPVFTNHSQERPLSCSQDFSIFSSIWM